MQYFKHDTAIVESDDIGESTKIWHFAHIRKTATIGRHCTIGKGVYIDVDTHLGDRVKVQNFVSVYKGVIIGDDVFLGPGMTFTNDLYPRAFHWNDEDIVKTYVHKGASIGANATIICGVHIGEYAMVGAGAVVTKDVPPHGLVLGNPAQIQGYVCRCGRRLTDIYEDLASTTRYECPYCKETVTIEKVTIK